MPLADKELNELILRPRFNFKIKHGKETTLTAFEIKKESQCVYKVSRVDEHIFIKIPKVNQDIFSPQLHLEISEVDANSSHIHGVFGPNPSIWTLFMFSHFVIGVLFIGVSVVVYSKWSLNQPINVYVILLLALTSLWIALYFLGKYRKNKSIPQMLEQHQFMRDVLRDLNKN